MSELVVSLFEDELKAEEVRLDLLRKQGEHLVELEDAVVLVRTRQGKVKLHHMTHFTVSGMVGGGFLGTLIGVMLLNPIFALFGLATGAVVGAVSGSLSHAGVDEDFMRDLAAHLKPGTSALCIIAREHLDNILEEIWKFNGRVFRTSLLHEDVTRLQAALDDVLPGNSIP